MNEQTETDLTTNSPKWNFTCPQCNEGFNFPAKYTSSFGERDMCPLCGHIFMEGLE